jgi:hypothetical protein
MDEVALHAQANAWGPAWLPGARELVAPSNPCLRNRDRISLKSESGRSEFMTQLDRDYHVQRARAELDLAQDAVCDVAARAHIRLSSLHMERAKQMTADPAELPFEHMSPR